MSKKTVPGTLCGYLRHEDGRIEVRLVATPAAASSAAAGGVGWHRSASMKRGTSYAFVKPFRPYYFITQPQLAGIRKWPEWEDLEPYLGLGFWPGKPAPAEPETPDTRERLLVHVSGTRAHLRLHLHLEPDEKHTGLLPGKKGHKQAKQAVEIIGAHGEGSYKPVVEGFERLAFALEAGWPVGPVLDEIRRAHHQVECKLAQESDK